MGTFTQDARQSVGVVVIFYDFIHFNAIIMSSVFSNIKDHCCACIFLVKNCCICIDWCDISNWAQLRFIVTMEIESIQWKSMVRIISTKKKKLIVRTK